MKTIFTSIIVLLSSLQFVFGQEDVAGKFDAIQGEWDVWISGAVTQRAVDHRVVQSYQPGASMNNLKIAADGSYTWGSVKSKLKLAKPWYAEANRDYFTVTDKSGNAYEFYHKKDTDKLILLFGGVGGHAATGHRIATGQGNDHNSANSQDQAAEKDAVTIKTETVASPAVGWKVGDQIEILWSASWYPGHILEIGSNAVKVHYTGWGSTFDEWVTLDRIRGTKDERADQRKQTIGETEKEPASGKFQVGQQVQINWSGIWYKGSILEVNNGKYKVRYAGWGSAYDEWVGPDRLKKL